MQPAVYCDLFPTHARYSGIAFAREITGAVVLGPLPLLTTAMLGWFAGAVWPIAGLTTLLCLITPIAVLAARPEGVA